MGKRLSVIVGLIILLALVGVSQAQAGGSMFSSLTFPNATNRSCGTWQASGAGGQNVPNWFGFYRVTDANENLLAVGYFSRIPVDGTLSGIFLRRPTRNPIRFVATGFYQGHAYSIGDISANNPCLPPFQPTPIPVSRTPVPPTFVPTLVPTLVGNPPPRVIIGCSQTDVRGIISQPITQFMRVQTVLASNLSVVLGTAVVPLENGYYSALYGYPNMPPGTRLIVSIGEWDGTRVVRPATLVGGDCIPATAATPTPIPTFVPSPTSSANYHIEYFNADHTSIPAGGCVVLSYWVVGAQRITLQGSNWTEVITDNPNQRTLCPSAASDYVPGQPVTYTLNVTYLNGTTESRAITIQVALPQSSPVPSPVPSTVPSAVPTAFSAPPTVTFGCSQTTIVVHGPKQAAPVAPFMRSQVVNTANNQVLAVRDVSLPDNPPYTIVLTYPVQPAGSHLNVAMFLWNGVTNVGPAAIYGGDCIPASTATPVPTTVPASPTLVPTLPPSLTPVPTFVPNTDVNKTR